MAAIADVLKRLNKSLKINVPIIVNYNQKSVEDLIKLLAKEKTVITIKKYEASYLVKVAKDITSLEALPKCKSVKKVKINKTANEMVQTDKGYLIISTSKGIMTNKQALEKQLGGIILGIIN